MQRNSGASLIRHIYLQLMGGRPSANWKCLVFHNTARPKAHFTMWMLLHGRLLTIDRLRQWGMVVETQCVLCHDHDESREHLFVNNMFIKSLWSKTMQWMQHGYRITNTWEQHLQWILQNAKEKSQRTKLFRMVYAEILHAICIERNLRIFERRARD